MSGAKLIVLGATGNVGRSILLSVGEFPSLMERELIACATSKSKGKQVSSSKGVLTTQTIEKILIKKGDIVISAISSDEIQNIADKITKKGAVLIDNSSYFREDSEIPLVIPEVNPEAIANYKNKNIIANPNCFVIQMLTPLKPLHDKFKIKRIVASTYQAVSGKGKAAMDELYDQTKGMFEAKEIGSNEFEKQIAFNCIPKIGPLDENGYSEEERKIIQETTKILKQENICVNPTCVRVPVFNCHAGSINVEFAKKFDIGEVKEILHHSSGVIFCDDRAEDSFFTQCECSQTNEVYVSRLRKDPTIKYGLSMWIVADNLRKGAALNALQIADIWQSNYHKDTI